MRYSAVAMRVGVEVDEHDLGRHVFQIERDAHAKTRQRSPEGEEFHGDSALSPSPHVREAGDLRSDRRVRRSSLQMRPLIRTTASATFSHKGRREEVLRPRPPSCARPDAPRSCSRADARRRRWRGRPRASAAALFARGLVLRRNVVQHRRQPALGLGHAHALARGIVLDLVALDLADAEIEAFGMAEIKPRHRRARPHRKALGQLHAGGVLGIEQAEQRRLLGVIGLRGIAGRRADAVHIVRGSADPAASVSSGA